MHLSERIDILAQTGTLLQTQLCAVKDNASNEKLLSTFEQACAHNPWFTVEQSSFALQSLIDMLKPEVLQNWLRRYDSSLFENQNEKTVAVIAPGNIPFACAHDLFCILLSGNKALIKPSSTDTLLIKHLVETIQLVDGRMADAIQFSDPRLKGFDAVIASGSNNSHRYFEQYFNDYPNILRGHRNSAATLTGNETAEELTNLSDDIFQYFGLGCRNVSKLFVPRDYDFTAFLLACEKWQSVMQHTKYMNNFDYQRAIFMMNQDSFFGNDFLILKKSNTYASPVSVLYFEEYERVEEAISKVNADAAQLQCVVSLLPGNNFVKPGKAQQPDPWDYADGVNTIQFLLNLKK
ncbi:MAG: acyl-CoA reductase [Bacteroidota bacterium]